MLLALLPAALAQADCPPLADHVDSAWDQFNDAELEAAKDSIGAAYEVLGCQLEVVPAVDLMELYRLDGLVSVAGEDNKGAVYATLRAVAADHVTGAPTADYGPELADLYALWSARMSETLIEVTVTGGGKVWLDGRPVDAASPLQATEGEHLIQVLDGGVLASEMHDLSDNIEIRTDDPLPEGFVPPTPRPVPPTTPLQPGPVPQPPIPTPSGRGRAVALIVSGVVAGGAGGALLVAASGAEQRFDDDPYRDPDYNGCKAGTVCYADARAQAVRADAAQIRALYVAGYTATALGLGVVSIGVISLPAQAGPAGVAVHTRF